MSAVVTVGNFSTDTGQLKNASSFFADMLPFFTKRALTYVDVGAYQAGVFSEILQSGLRIREAHLIEPNPRSFAAAREQVGKLKTQHSVDFYNVAIGARAGRVKLHDAGTMTKVLDDKAVAATLGMDESSAIEVDCTTLDALAQNITERHISLLKIDVEGQEIEALTGAKNLLKEERVDVIYIEAGINPKGTQQCYYRRIEDFLRKYGYGLFRIYEQHNEWMEDSPLLRRVNLAFMSRRFAQSNPYRLTKDLHKANERLEALQQKIDYSASQIASLERTSKDAQSKLQTAAAERDDAKLALAAVEAKAQTALAEMQAAMVEHESFKKGLARTEETASTLKREVEKLAKERDGLEQSLAATRMTHDTLLAEQRAVAIEYEQVKNSLELSLAEAHKSRDALLAEQQALTAEHNQAKAALQDIQQTVGALQNNLNELQSRIEAAESELATAAAQRDSLQAALALAEAHATAQSVQLADLTSEREELESSLMSSKHSNDALQEKLRAATVERNELAAELATTTTRVAEATEHRDALVTALLQAEQTSSRLSATLETLAAERRDLAQALTQSQQTQDTLKAELQSVTAERDSVNTTLEESEKAIAALRARLEISQQTNAELERRIAEVQYQLDQADQQRDTLQIELARAEGTSAELTTRIAQLSEERRELASMLSESNATRHELAVELARVGAERDSIETARKAEREALEAAIGKADAHANTLTASINRIAGEHQALAQELEVSQNARRSLLAELDIVTAAREQLKECLTQAEVTARNLTAEVRALVTERSELQDAVKKAEITADGYRQGLVGSEQTNRELADKVNMAQSKASDLAHQCQNLKQSLAQSEQTISKLSAKNDVLAAKREDLKSSLAKSKSERDRLSQKLQNAAIECDSIKEMLRNSEKIVDAYQQDLEASQVTSQELQQTLRDLFESTAQLHRRELRAWKELRRIRNKNSNADGNPDGEANTTAEEAAAPSIIKFSADTNTIYVPLTLSRHTIVASSSKAGHIVRMTYLAEPSATGTVEVTLRAEHGLHQVVAVGGEKLLNRDESVIRLLDVRSGQNIRLFELEPACGEVRFEIRRARGYFGMLKLEQTSNTHDALPPAKQPKSRVTLLANALGTSVTAPVATAPHAAFSPSELSHKLWGGFSRYAIPALEQLKLDSRASLGDREAAAWYLTQWFAVEEEFSRALENIQFAKHLVGKLRQKFVLAETQCLIQLGRFSQALAVIDHAIAAKPVNDYYLLRSTIVRHMEVSNGSPPEQMENAQLEALNFVFAKAGVAPLQKRRSDLPLTLGNVTAIARPKTTEQSQKLSIVIPAFNAAETIEWVLESLLEQTWRNLEIIVVDDVSSDNTGEIVEAISKRDSRVRLLRQRVNSGAYASRNAGVRVATGDYLMVHDSDDWSHPQRIEMQIAALNANPKCVAVKSYWVRVGSNIEIFGAWLPKPSLLDLNYSSLLFRRDLMDKTGLWDEVSVGGDAEFYTRLRAIYGEESVLKIHEDTPLALALTREDSLTRCKATHLKSNYYGLRWNYMDSCRFWHTRLQQEKTRAGLAPTTMTLPFAAPLGNRPKKGAIPRYDLVVVADLAAEGQALDRTLQHLRAAANAGLKVGVFHWRQYEMPTRAPLQPAFYETRLQYPIDVLSPGDTADANLVLFTQPEILQHRIDPMPIIRTTQAAAIVDETYSGDPILARAHLQSILGTDALWIPETEAAKRLMQGDKRFPAVSDASCLNFGR